MFLKKDINRFRTRGHPTGAQSAYQLSYWAIDIKRLSKKVINAMLTLELQNVDRHCSVGLELFEDESNHFGKIGESSLRGFFKVSL